MLSFASFIKILFDIFLVICLLVWVGGSDGGGW